MERKNLCFPTPTMQPTICVSLCDLRGVWKSPRRCKLSKTFRAALSRQRSRVRVSSSPPFFFEAFTEWCFHLQLSRNFTHALSIR